MDIKKLFGYTGKNVVITGAASKMAKSAAELLISLGANVYAIDKEKIELPVTKVFAFLRDTKMYGSVLHRP